MSHYFRAAALSDAALVEPHRHNATTGFESFRQKALMGEASSTTALLIEKESDRFTAAAKAQLAKPESNPQRSTSHLNNAQSRVQGLRFSRSTPTDPTQLRGSQTAPQRHTIDILHQGLRDAILADIDEDLRRRILALELN